MAVKPAPVKKSTFKSPVDIIICPGKYDAAIQARLTRLSDFVAKSSQAFHISLQLTDTSWDEALTSDKSIAEATGKQKLTASKTTQKSESKVLLEASEKSNSAYIFPYNITGRTDIEVVCRFLGGLNRTEITDQPVIMGWGNVKTPAKPIGVGKRFFAYMSDFWHRLLTGIDGRNASLGMIVYPKATATSYLAQLGQTGKSVYHTLMAMSMANGIEYAETPLDLSSQNIRFGSGFSSAIKAKLSTIVFFIQWFIRIPLYVFKTKPAAEGSMLGNSNHPGYRMAFFTTAVIALFAMVSVSSDYNVTWDEPNHNNYAADVLDYYTTMGEDTSMFNFQAEGHKDYFTNVFYGMSIDVFGALCNRVLGFEETVAKKDQLGITITSGINADDTLYNNRSKRYAVDEKGDITLKRIGNFHVEGKTLHQIKDDIRGRLNNNVCVSASYVSFKPHMSEFAVRHFLNTLAGFLCLLFAGLCGRLIGGWRLGFLVFIAMLCSPSFLGHSFNNPKDMPFATGFIMGIYYLIRLIQEMPKPRLQTKTMLAIAIGFAISIRVPGLMLIAFLVGFMGLHWLLQVSSGRQKFNSVVNYLKIVFVVTVIGYVIGIITWPYALRDPMIAPFTAFKEFQNFSYLTYYELFEGTRQYIKPWYYEPKMIMITAPMLVLAGLALFALLSLLKIRKHNAFPIILLILVTFVPACYSIYKKSYVYNGWRHFLFVYPTLVVLAILGWEWLMQTLKARIAAGVIIAVVLIGAAVPGYWGIKNHPYEYLYFNELTGGLKGAQGIYETDYWNQTPREAFAWLIKEVPALKQGDQRISSNNIQEALKTFVPEGYNAMYKWTREYEWANDDWKYAIWTTRTLSKNQILDGYWPPKGTIKTIDVDGVPIAAIVRSDNNYGYLGHKYLAERKMDSSIYFYKLAMNYNPLEEEFLRGLGDAYKNKGNADSALLFYNKALTARDGNYEALFSIGETYLSKATAVNPQAPDPELLTKAREHLEQSVFYKENNASAYYYLGELLLTENEPEAARNCFNKTIEFGPNIAQAYNGLGKAQLAIGESDSAINNFYIATQLDKRYPEPLYMLANELQKRGQNKEAQEYIQRYQQLTGMPPTF